MERIIVADDLIRTLQMALVIFVDGSFDRYGFRFLTPACLVDRCHGRPNAQSPDSARLYTHGRVPHCRGL